MGYDTDFSGEFKLNKKLDLQIAELINGLANTRRMKRNISELAKKEKITLESAKNKYGIEGEFYYDKNDFHTCGQTEDDSIIDYNLPPSDQPSLWCQWVYDPKSNVIKWDQNEKFYNYVDWIKYIIDKILKPNNFSLTGVVKWVGQDIFDKGEIRIKNNTVKLIEQ